MPVHVEDTAWEGPTLHFWVRDEAGDVRDLDLTGGFDWDVGEGVHGVQEPPLYVFEPRPVEAIREELQRATEPEKQRIEAELALCDREHVVYAAFYGILPKVGMTSRTRLEARLREQGADAGFVISTASDRAEARRIETSVARLYGLPEWRRAGEVLRQLTRPIDWDRIRERADDLRERLHGLYEPEPALVRIEDAPLPLPLQAPPERVPAWGRHKGTWLGAKGNHLFYEAAATPGRLDIGSSPVHAVRRQDLVGRTITIVDA